MHFFIINFGAVQYNMNKVKFCGVLFFYKFLFNLSLQSMHKFQDMHTVFSETLPNTQSVLLELDEN